MWHGLRVVWLMAMAPVVFAAIAAALMIERDITAPSWVAERVEARVARMLGGGAIEFGEITLNIGRDLHPRAKLFNTVLKDANGETLARVAQVSGLVSPRGLLFERAALVQEVRLSGVQIDLRRDSDGQVAVSFGPDTTQAGTAANFTELLDLVDQTFARPELAAFEQVQVDGVVINYADARAGRQWVADGGRLGLDVRGGQTRFSVGLSVLLGGDLGVVALDYKSPQDNRAADVVMRLENIPSSDLASQSPALAWLATIDAPLSAALSTGLDESGALTGLAGRLKIGKGEVRAGAGLAFEGADVALSYDPASQHVTFNRVALQTEWGDMIVRGQAFSDALVNGLPNVLIGQFQALDLALNPNGLYPAPVQFGDVSADLRLQLDPFRLDVGQVVLASDTGTLVASGFAAPFDAGWLAQVDLVGDEVTNERLMTLWPGSFRPGTRTWFANHLDEIRMTDLNLAWRLVPERAPRLMLQFAFDDMRVRPLLRLPPVQDGAGVASLIDNRFVMRLDNGHVTAPEGGQVDMTGSFIDIPDTTEKNGPLILNMQTDGGITAALSLLNQPPFGFLDRAGLPVTLADGRARANAEIRFPRQNPIPPGSLSYDVTAQLSRVATTKLIPNRRLASSALEVSANNAQLSVGGAATLDGIAMRGSWTQVMGQSGSQVAVRVPLSADSLAAFGIGLPSGAVSGAGQGDLRVDIRQGEAPRYRLNSDLQGVRLRVDQIGWNKPARAAGTLDVAGRLGARPSVESLFVQGGGLTAEGRLDLASNGGLEAARFTRVQIGRWFDAPVTLRGRGANRPVGVEIAGGLLDLGRARFGAGNGGEGGPLEIALDRLQVTDQIALRGFRGAFSSNGGLSGQFTATVNGGPGVRGTIAPQNGRTAVRVQSDDAGAVVAAAGLLKNGVGGALDLRLIPTGAAGVFDGYLDIDRIRVRDAPAMAALLDAISVVGLLQQLDGQGLSFDEVDARFRLEPGRIVVTEAAAVGPGLGISMDGTYSTANQAFDMQGVVSPFYLLNGIGSVLTRRGEGLIGFNFNIRGTADAPDVAVNPLSALTPGMFRDIFRRPPPQVSP